MVKELVGEIKKGLTQVSSSQKDETRVMRAMLNDRDYVVDVYGKDGKEGTYCPAKSARTMLASVISGATKISHAEAETLSTNYEFKRTEAEAMVDISKEFINTYVQTGRKLPLGARETSNVALSAKHVDASIRLYPKKTGTTPDGKAKYEKAETKVNAHDSIKVYAPCPSWVK